MSTRPPPPPLQKPVDLVQFMSEEEVAAVRAWESDLQQVISKEEAEAELFGDLGGTNIGIVRGRGGGAYFGVYGLNCPMCVRACVRACVCVCVCVCVC